MAKAIDSTDSQFGECQIQAEAEECRELYLALQQIEHRNTRVHHPQTNGFCERFHRTLKDEFFSVALRKKHHGSLQELQEDLDTWLRFYNEERSHQGYRTQGRMPWQAFQDGVAAMTQPQAA